MKKLISFVLWIIAIWTVYAWFNAIDRFQLQIWTRINEISTDVTLWDSSDLAVPTEHAVKVYVDGLSFGWAPNNFITGLSFNINNGLLTIYRTGMDFITWNLDGRYLIGSWNTWYIPKFTDINTVGNSLIYETWYNIGIGLIEPTHALDISWELRIRTITYSGSLTWILVTNESWIVYQISKQELLSWYSMTGTTGWWSGIFESVGGLIREIASVGYDDSFIVWDSQLDFNGTTERMFFDAWSFRAGWSSTEWDLVNRGIYSIWFGFDNMTKWAHSSILWWINNIISGSADKSVIWGGEENVINNDSDHSFVWWGRKNVINNNSSYSFIWWWYSGYINNVYSVIWWGEAHYLDWNHSFIGWGLSAYLIWNKSFIGWGDSNSISADYWFIWGGQNNAISWWYSVIVGWINNNIESGYVDTYVASFIGGGEWNFINWWYSFIGWWRWNSMFQAQADPSNYSFIWWGSGGHLNWDYSFIGGGEWNYLNGNYSFIWWGKSNKLESTYAVIVGWEYNNITGESNFSSILGWESNVISNAIYSVAMWNGAYINSWHDYTFVWNGETNGTIFGSQKAQTFLINAPKWVSINTWYIPDTTTISDGIDLNIEQVLRIAPSPAVPFTCDQSYPDVEGSVFFYKTATDSYLCYCGYWFGWTGVLGRKRVADDTNCAT